MRRTPPPRRPLPLQPGPLIGRESLLEEARRRNVQITALTHATLIDDTNWRHRIIPDHGQVQLAIQFALRYEF